MNKQNFQGMFSHEKARTPHVWVTTSHSDQSTGSAAHHNLARAERHAEQLIEALSTELGMDVPISYLRAERSIIFHVLLLISEHDFHSPKILAARILANQFAKPDGFDIKFVFAIESENMMDDIMGFDGYKLIRRNNSQY